MSPVLVVCERDQTFPVRLPPQPTLLFVVQQSSASALLRDAQPTSYLEALYVGKHLPRTACPVLPPRVVPPAPERESPMSIARA